MSAIVECWKHDLTSECIERAVDEGCKRIGLQSLKKEQFDAVKLLLSGRHTFVTLPTGYGKSAIFSVLPFCAQSLLSSTRETANCRPFVLVISPLISLMRDQVTKLKHLGISALFLGDQLDPVNPENIQSCYFSHIFSSPEALLKDSKWRIMLLSDDFASNLTAIIIDEAHCIVKWGMGDVFRPWYARIVEIQSLLPSSIPVAALTATATPNTEQNIVKLLQLHSYETIHRSPDRPNIKYLVHKVSRDFEKSFYWLIQDLRKLRINTPKIIIFCRLIGTCAALYQVFLSHLLEESYEPMSSPPDISNCLFAMYHAKVDEDEKAKIFASMSNPNGKCRVLISTIAFGMGVDIPDIRLVIHFGPSRDVDDYFQESGRCGRDGKESKAILYVFPGCLLGHVSPRMKQYVNNQKECRRYFLLQSFSKGDILPLLPPRKFCCDICDERCPSNSEIRAVHLEECVDEEYETCLKPVREVSELQREELRRRLHDLQQNYLERALDVEGYLQPLYSGVDLACGLSDKVIESIIEVSDTVFNVEDLEQKCLLWGHHHEIMEIIESVYNK